MNDFFTQKLILLKNYFDKNRVIGIIIFFSVLCLISVLNLLLSNILPEINISSYQFNDYVLSFVNPYKYITFIKYGLFIAIIALAALGSFALYKNETIYNKIEPRYPFVPFYVVFSVLTLFINSDKLYKIVVLLLLFLFFTVFCFNFNTPRFKISNKIKNFFFIIFTSLIFMQFCHIFYPFVFQKVKIINEFYDIPEITLINTNNGKQEVDNIDFINKYHINGLQSRYDIRKADKAPDVFCIPFAYSKNLEYFLHLLQF